MKKLLLAAALLGTFFVQSCSVGRDSYKTGRDPHYHGGYRDIEYRNNNSFPGR